MSGPAAERRIAEARQALKLLGFDREQTNERSALVLLALLGLPPDSSWSAAGNPQLRTVELMAWLREHYGRDYKPNTRETIRRRTLHQFIDAGLVLLNPDQPGRPVNSPNNCYQIAPDALALLSDYGADDFERLLGEYLEKLPGLRAQYARETSWQLCSIRRRPRSRASSSSPASPRGRRCVDTCPRSPGKPTCGARTARRI